MFSKNIADLPDSIISEEFTYLLKWRRSVDLKFGDRFEEQNCKYSFTDPQSLWYDDCLIVSSSIYRISASNVMLNKSSITSEQESRMSQ